MYSCVDKFNQLFLRFDGERPQVNSLDSKVYNQTYIFSSSISANAWLFHFMRRKDILELNSFFCGDMSEKPVAYRGKFALRVIVAHGRVVSEWRENDQNCFQLSDRWRWVVRIAFPVAWVQLELNGMALEYEFHHSRGQDNTCVTRAISYLINMKLTTLVFILIILLISIPLMMHYYVSQVGFCGHFMCAVQFATPGLCQNLLSTMFSLPKFRYLFTWGPTWPRLG